MASYVYVGSRDLTAIETALIAHFGADNVTIHTSAASKLIFTVAAICDKPIRLTVVASQLLAAYGTAYNAGTVNVDNPVFFGGTNDAGIGSTYAVCLTDNTLLVNWLTTTQNSKIILVGKLTNNAYAVLGCVGTPTVGYNAGHYGYLTATDTGIWVVGLAEDMRTSTGKVLKVPVTVYDLVAGSPLTIDGVPAAFEGISICSRQLGQTIMHKGSDYFITTSGMYDNDVRRLYNSLLVEGIV